MHISRFILAAGFFLALVVSACTITPKDLATGKNTFKNSYWMLLSIEGQSPQQPNNTHTAYIQFDANTKDVIGYTGCNRFFGKYEGNEETKTLTLSNLGATKMMCPSINLESQLLRLLGQVTSYSISEDVLTLYASGEAVATFRAGPKPTLGDEMEETIR